MEARAHPLHEAATPRRRPGPGGKNRRQPTRPLAAQPQPRARHCSAKRLLRRARRRNIGAQKCCLIRRTAVYGPVRTVVWEGRSREALPYPDYLRCFIRATRCPIRYALVALLLSSVLCPLSSVSAQTPQEVQKIAEQAIRRLDLQTTLPREPEMPSFSIPLPAEALWLVIAVAVGVVIYAFRDMLPIWRLGQGGAWTADEMLPGDVTARTPAAVLGAADEVAAVCRFVEAMHVLLLQVLSDIRRRLAVQFADSLTSRELLRSPRLSEAGRG